MQKNQYHNDNKNQLSSIAMVDVILERDGKQFIAAPGQAFPYQGEKITRYGAAEIWLYYGVKKKNAYCTSERTAHDLIDCLESGVEDITLGLTGGIYILLGHIHPSMVCTKQVPLGFTPLRLKDISYMESRSRANTSCMKRLLPYTYVPYTDRLHEACPNCSVHDMYVPTKKGATMEKKALIRIDFPISFTEADKLVEASSMHSPKMHESIVEYLMYAHYLFLTKYGLSTSEIYVGWTPEEPQCDHLVDRQEYEHLLFGQDTTFRIKASAPYDKDDPFGFFDVSRSRLCKSILSGECYTQEVKSLY